MTNPFVDQDIPSLQWLRDEIARRYDIPRQRRMDMVSACNMAAKWFHLPLANIPANAAFLRKKFGDLHPCHTGAAKRPVSAQRIQNVKSLIWAAMREAGPSTKLLPYGAKKLPEWQALFDLLDGRYLRTELSCFMGFCSNQKIKPSEVDDAVMDGFLEALEKESPKKHPRTSHQTTCRTWNMAADEVPGWPPVKVTVPRYDTRKYAISDDLVHPDLSAAISNYLSKLAGEKLFGGPKKPFRPSSLKLTKGNIHRYLSALHHSGHNVSAITTLEEMVSFHLFTRAIEWLWERNGKKSSGPIEHIAWVIRCIAVKHLTCDEATREKFTSAMAELRVRHKGLAEKNRLMLQQFDDPRTVSRLLTCPDALWEVARKETGKKAQLLAQSAVLIEILIHAPLRISNLTTLRLDRHLNRVDGQIYINVPAAESKNSEPLHYVLPLRVAQRIDEYIEHWRSLFLPGSNPHLFPGRDNRPKDETAVRQQIKRALFRQTGIRLTPHQFRHVVAKLILDAHPGCYELVRKLLGHRSHSVAYENYAGTEVRSAFAFFDKNVLGRSLGGAAASDPHASSDRADLPFMNPYNPAAFRGRSP